MKSADADVTIYYNPACGTSRNTLALIRHAGIEPVVVEYLETPPTRQKLQELVDAMGITVRELMRRKGTPYDALGLDGPWTDEELFDFIGRYPILTNRPVVVTPLGTNLCRPSEKVLELLPVDQCIAPFTKEDGEVVVDAGIRRGRR